MNKVKNIFCVQKVIYIQLYQGMSHIPFHLIPNGRNQIETGMNEIKVNAHNIVRVNK